MSKKVCCVLIQISADSPSAYKRYDGLAKCAVSSFKKFHPSVETFLITNENIDDFLMPETSLYESAGLNKFIIARDIALKFGFEKIISIGVDTITCSRLDEFMDDNETDILMTLNYPMPEKTQFWETPTLSFTYPDGKVGYDVANINADVVCFNSIDALNHCIDLTLEHPTLFCEQGSLNEMAWSEKKYTFKIVDFPYPLSKVVYNARSKGVVGTEMCNKSTPQYRWKVKNNNLYTEDNKHIKIWHYIEALGCQDNKKFESVINDWIFNLFNDDTKKFFEEHCDCGDFFKKSYTIEVSNA